MSSFEEIIQCQMQSPTFIEILNNHFPLRSDVEHQQIIDEVNVLITQCPDITNSTTSLSPSSFRFQNLALDYLQTFVNTIICTRTQNMTPDDQNHTLPDFFQDTSIDNDLDFSLSALDDDNSDSDFDTNTSYHADLNSAKLNDVWSLVVQKTLQDQTTKTSSAA